MSTSAAGRPASRIAVFGSSTPLPGETGYEMAREVGAELVPAGYTVVTGGYGGVMEGASRGAIEAGGRAIGVLCAGFGPRRPNPYLTERIDTADLHERMRVLVDLAAGYVVLPGQAGTLAELALLWALERAGSLGRRPVILLSARWSPLLDLLVRDEMLEPSQLAVTRIVHGPRDVVPALAAFAGRTEED